MKGSICGRFDRVAATLAVLACVAISQTHAASAERLEIDTSSGPHVFKVEVMRTEPEHERGLMYRKTMARDHGMLFQYAREQPVTFWMKNTYLPLDMIFIGQDGRVVNVKHDAKPMDESLIPSEAPTLGVLEVDAGVAESIGLQVGDVVKHPMFHDVTGGR